MFLKAKPKLVQCTSCNTTGLSRLALAARPLGLTAILGNIDRRHGDPHTVVKASPSAIQFGKGAGHQGTDAGTVFEEVKFSIRASKVPTTVPHTNFLNLVFKGDVSPAQLVEQLAKTREVVVMPYQDEGKKHEWTSEILEAFLSGSGAAYQPGDLRADRLRRHHTLQAGRLHHSADGVHGGADVHRRAQPRGVLPALRRLSGSRCAQPWWTSPWESCTASGRISSAAERNHSLIGQPFHARGDQRTAYWRKISAGPGGRP